MLEYKCPKCGLTFITFRTLCGHAELCHEVNYLSKETTDIINIGSFSKPFPSFVLKNLKKSILLGESDQNDSRLEHSLLDFKAISLNKSSDRTDIVQCVNNDERPIFKNAPSLLHLRVPQKKFNGDMGLLSTCQFPYKNKTQFRTETSSKVFEKSVSTESQTEFSNLLWANPQNDRSDLLEQLPMSSDFNENNKDEPLQYYETALQIVFSNYLEVSDLWKCRSVSKSWKILVERPEAWISVHFRECIISPKILLELSKWSHNLIAISFQDVGVRDVYLSKGELETGLEPLLNSSKHIKTISIINCGNHFTERVFWIVSCHCPYLEHFAYISIAHPASPESLWSLGAGCRLLRTIIVPPIYPNLYPERFCDNCLGMIGKCWPNLKNLCVGGTSVTLRGLMFIAKLCQFLEVLELDHMGEIEESAIPPLCGVGLRRLTFLYLTHTPMTPQAILQVKYFCKNIKKIKLIVSPGDYFLHPHLPSNKAEYDKKIISLKDLYHHQGMNDLLSVKDAVQT